MTKPTLFILLFLTVFGSVTAQQKTPARTAVLPPTFDKSRQAILVLTDDWSSTTGRAVLFSRTSAKSRWKTNGTAFDVVIGRGGLKWGTGLHPASNSPDNRKAEGDGASPAGIFALGTGFGTAPKSNDLKLEFLTLGEFTECVDDAASIHYNRIVDRMKVGVFDWKSSEKMLTMQPDYEIGVFVHHNSFPVVRGAGSCIFLHVWNEQKTPTVGCTAMSRESLERVMKWIDPATNPVLIQLPREMHGKYRKQWNLPPQF